MKQEEDPIVWSRPQLMSRNGYSGTILEGAGPSDTPRGRLSLSLVAGAGLEIAIFRV